jgi:hypothetical protein
MTDPTSRQRGHPPQKNDKTVTLKKKISGQKSHIWARLTDRQSQCDFDFEEGNCCDGGLLEKRLIISEMIVNS